MLFECDIVKILTKDRTLDWFLILSYFILSLYLMAVIQVRNVAVLCVNNKSEYVPNCGQETAPG